MSPVVANIGCAERAVTFMAANDAAERACKGGAVQAYTELPPRKPAPMLRQRGISFNPVAAGVDPAHGPYCGADLEDRGTSR